MLSWLRHNLVIILPTLLWSGLLVVILVGAVLFEQFRSRAGFTLETAGSLAEQLTPVIGAFFAAGILDAEVRRGAHELICSRRVPLWRTALVRLMLVVLFATLIGGSVLLLLHLTLKRLPLGWLILASVPSTLCLATTSLWTRVRFGNPFLGYVTALTAYVVNVAFSALYAVSGVPVNPLIDLSSYTLRLRAEQTGALETTPYVDWWWAPKVALIVISLLIFQSLTRRVERQAEQD